MENKSDQKNRGKRKQQNVRQLSEEASPDDDNAKKDLDADQRLRHKLSTPKIYDLMKSIDGKRRKYEIIRVLNESGFGGMVHICKWTKIHTFFVEWVVKRFEKDNMWIRLSKTDVLPLKEEDVHRVYELPMAGEQINTKLCSETAIKRLRVELGLDGDNSAFVKVTELEKILQRMEKPKTWAEEHLNYCRGCIEVYSTAAKTLQRRICEANASTSSTEKSPKNLPHLNDANSEETSTTNEAEQEDNKSSGADKGVEVPEIQENKKSSTEKVVEVSNTKEKQSSSTYEEEKISKTGDMSSFNAGQAQGEPSNPNPSTQAENRFNKDDDTKSNEENDNDEEVEIDAKIIDEEACNVGISLTQETILDFPEFFGPSNAAFNKDDDTKSNEENDNDEEVEIDAKMIDDSMKAASTQETTNASENQVSATQETILKYPEFFDNDSTKKEPKQSLALVLVPDPDVKHGGKPTECDPNIVIDATPLKSVLPYEIINLDDVTTKKRKKHNMLYSDSTYPERRQAVKKSKYLASPYDDAVHESTASELQKNLSTYAWSPDLDE
ncbi:hypothetical protein QL285_002978 [Trifolium repens]|nr:hypothetical protein QL285_002978 [Trifolium repens]